MSTIAKQIYHKLHQFGVKDVFIYSGGAIMPLIDQFSKEKNSFKINYYISSNEDCCGKSAVGYAKSSGKIGVVITTSGPGLTNAVTSILDAQADSTPLMVISGQVGLKAMGTNAFQEAPSTRITKSITKFNHLIKSSDEVDNVFDHAYQVAMSGKKGAVHIDVPKCILNSEWKPTYSEVDMMINNFNHSWNVYQKNKHKKIEGLYEASQLINNSKRPVIYAGKGCTDYKTSLELYKFAVTGNIPVTTTLLGLGCFDENEPLSLKMVGMHGSYAANMAMQNADLIIALGTRFDDRTTGRLDSFAPKAKNIIHVNIEESEINKVVKTSHNFNMDCKSALDAFSSLVQFKSRRDWINLIEKWNKAHPLTYKPMKNKLYAQEVLIKLDSLMQQDGSYRDPYILTSGVGNHQMYTAQFITHRHPNRFITSGSLGVMGSSLPYAIGAQIANPTKKIIAIDGDGSFNMTLNDLLTVKRYNLPIKILIMNNSSQDMVRVWEELYMGGRITATEMDNPDFSKIAEGYGIKAMNINSSDTLTNTLDEFLRYDKAILLNCIVEKDMCLPLVGPGKALDEMLLLNDVTKNHNFTGDAPS